MIIVAGHLRVAASDRERFVTLSAEAVGLARAAPGCRDFAVSADAVDPERVNVFERWEDRAALSAFRGEGPEGDIGTMILSADMREYEVD